MSSVQRTVVFTGKRRSNNPSSFQIRIPKAVLDHYTLRTTSAGAYGVMIGLFPSVDSRIVRRIDPIARSPFIETGISNSVIRTADYTSTNRPFLTLELPWVALTHSQILLLQGITDIDLVVLKLNFKSIEISITRRVLQKQLKTPIQLFNNPRVNKFLSDDFICFRNFPELQKLLRNYPTRRAKICTA